MNLESFLLPWLVRFSGWLLTTFHTQPDGHSAFYKITGAEYGHAVVPFGETVMVREARPVDTKLNPRWKRGIWLGRTTTSNENIVATEDGTVVSRTVRRLPPAARWTSSW